MSRYLYQQPLGRFLEDVEADRIEALLAAELLALNDQEAGESERTSWRRSLAALAAVLRDEALARSEIFVELFMPLNGKRCDVLLTGRTTEGPSAVVIELKQWTKVSPSHLPDHVLGGGHNTVHPSVQVDDYVNTLRHYHSAFTGGGEPIALSGAVFLHDLAMKEGGHHLRDAVFGDMPQRCPLFLRHEHAALARFLAARLVPGPGAPVAERVRAGYALPSPRLLDLVVQTIRHEHDWRLLDEQKTAFFEIRHAVTAAKMDGKRRVIIVHGGPGTGKSVIAIQLLAYAAENNWRVAHATGSKAFQTVLQATTIAFSQAMLKRLHSARTRAALPVGELFTTFADVAKLGARDPGRLDLAICDEAHRLWQHRRIKYPNGQIKWLSEQSMVQEVIAASLVTAFFLDDNQSVRSGEIGHSRMIEKEAAAMGVEVKRFDLEAQFRCAGSSSYLHWVEGLLGRRDGLDLEWREHGAYELKIWTNMGKLDEHLRRLSDQGRRCRLVAGYCWRWSKPDRMGKLPRDLQHRRFGDWSGAWIEKTGKDLKPLDHQYYRWATLPESYEQVGSIYSVQGFEFDYIGVIWGEDLVWRGGRWVAQLDQNKDNAFKKELRNSGGDPVEKLLNIYRVLLTRGMRSTHLFILDDETREHVRACAEAQTALARAVGMLPEPPARLAGAAARAPQPLGKVLRLPPREHARLRPVTPDPRDPWRGAVPLVDLRAAAGGFSAEQLLREALAVEEWYSWDGAPPFRRGDFLARVVGSSMAPDIPPGSLCLFRLSNLETATGRPVLARLAAKDDESAGYTVKDLHVEWTEGREGQRAWRRIELRPRNAAHPTLYHTPQDGRRLTIIAEVMAIVAEGSPE
jgi:hypothetical protein